MEYIAHQTFENNNHNTLSIANVEYENCVFINCNFMQAAFEDIKWIDCTFEQCDFSLATPIHLFIQGAHFKNCRFLGFKFDELEKFGLSFSFDHCILDDSSFYAMKLQKANFDSCHLHRVDFTSADLSQSRLLHCDLQDATFDNTNLEKADFRHSTNYVINPQNNKIKKAKFNYPGVLGLLYNFGIIIE